MRPFVIVGFSNGLAFSSSQNIRYYHNRNYEQGLIGAAGARTGRVTLGEVRYERGNGMSTGGELNHPNRNCILAAQLCVLNVHSPH